MLTGDRTPIVGDLTNPLAAVPAWSLLRGGAVETVPRFSLADVPADSGKLRIGYCSPSVDTLVTNLGVAVNDDVPDAVTMSRLGLFTAAADGSLTLVARTANTLTIGSVPWQNVLVPLATAGGYPASYLMRGGVMYALGFLQVGGTTCGIRFAGITNIETAPTFSRQIEAQTDILPSYDVGDLAATDQAIYLFATA